LLHAYRFDLRYVLPSSLSFAHGSVPAKTAISNLIDLSLLDNLDWLKRVKNGHSTRGFEAV
jgi:hypothetical protein